MTRTTVLLLTAVVLLSGIPMSATAATSQEVTLTVSVVDRNGNPVDDATVQATWDGGNATEETSSNGKTFVDAPAGADVEIDVTHDEYIRNTNYVVESASAEDVEITVAERGTASVEVTDADGNPVSNAWVRLWQDGNRIVSERTGDNGVHQTKAIEQGEYNLFVFKEGYRRNDTELTVGGDVSEGLSIESDSVTVTFQVNDHHFGTPNPVQDATVSIAETEFSQSTLQSGEATTSVPVNDEYEVTVTKDGYNTTMRTLDVEEESTSMDLSIRRTPAISIDSLADRVVVGENVSIDVTNEYGTPVANASVTVDGQSVGETDENGEFKFSIDSEGEHAVEVTADGLQDTATIDGIDPSNESGNGSETAANTTTGSSGDGPGFTPLLALLGALLAVALMSRR